MFELSCSWMDSQIQVRCDDHKMDDNARGPERVALILLARLTAFSKLFLSSILLIICVVAPIMHLMLTHTIQMLYGTTRLDALPRILEWFNAKPLVARPYFDFGTWVPLLDRVCMGLSGYVLLVQLYIHGGLHNVLG